MISLPISFLYQKFPNSKILKAIYKSWERISELISDGLQGI